MTRSNGANTSLAYDDLNRVTSLSHTVSNTGYNAGWSFAYNAASQITSLTSTNAVYDYVEAAKSTENPTYDGLNRDASIAAVAGGYDANGNLANEGAGGRAMTYDMDNRLLTVTGGTAPVTMSYDPTGRLASYTAGSTTTQFLYDGTNLIGEYVGGSMVRRYMHATGTDQPFVEFAGTGTAATDASFLLANYQGSIIALTNSGGAVDTTRVFHYGPYGEPTDINGNPAWGGERFGYTGQTVLPEARLYYYKARVYDPKYGRFLQTDSIGPKDDEDLYAYTGDDPVNAVDPSGNQAENDPDFTDAVRTDENGRTYSLGSTGRGDSRSENNYAGPIASNQGDYISPQEAESARVDQEAEATYTTSCSVDPAVAAKQTQLRTASRVRTQPGSYTNHFESGTTYDGQGSRSRSQRSAAETTKRTGDRHVATDWTPSPTRRDGFKDESRRMERNPGPTYNRRRSPGDKYRKQDDNK